MKQATTNKYAEAKLPGCCCYYGVAAILTLLVFSHRSYYLKAAPLPHGADAVARKGDIAAKRWSPIMIQVSRWHQIEAAHETNQDSLCLVTMMTG